MLHYHGWGRQPLTMYCIELQKNLLDIQYDHQRPIYPMCIYAYNKKQWILSARSQWEIETKHKLMKVQPATNPQMTWDHQCSHGQILKPSPLPLVKDGDTETSTFCNKLKHTVIMLMQCKLYSQQQISESFSWVWHIFILILCP